MATSFGVTPSGFIRKPMQQILADMNSDLQAANGNTINTSPQSNFGQLSGILSDRLADCWEGLEAVHAAFYPDSSTGADLVQVCGITGTVPKTATASALIDVVLIGTNGTNVPAGSTASVGGGADFYTNALATIATLAAWGTSQTKQLGNLVTNTGNVYVCIQEGETAATGSGPTGTGAGPISDGGAEWLYAGVGTAAVTVGMTAGTGPNSQVLGPTVANGGTLNTIVSTVFGWSSIFNPFDAVLGVNAENDSALRVRREAELRGQGNAAVNAVQAAVSRVTGVTQCVVYENDTDSTVGGLPPHSIHVVCSGGEDQDVWNAILASKAAGIQTYGSITGTATDSQGVTHSISFDNLAAVPIWIIVDLKTNVGQDGWDAVNGATDVVNALLAWAVINQTGGVGVYASKLYAPIFDNVSGIQDVTSILIGTSASPSTSTPIAISPSQFAEFESLQITVNVTLQ